LGDEISLVGVTGVHLPGKCQSPAALALGICAVPLLGLGVASYFKLDTVRIAHGFMSSSSSHVNISQKIEKMENKKPHTAKSIMTASIPSHGALMRFEMPHIMA
jgi:hypothetical protein